MYNHKYFFLNIHGNMPCLCFFFTYSARFRHISLVVSLETSGNLLVFVTLVTANKNGSLQTVSYFKKPNFIKNAI